MTKTTNYDALRITDIYGGGGTFITRGYYSIPENHDQLFDIIKTPVVLCMPIRKNFG